jgi:hypothetical protein
VNSIETIPDKPSPSANIYLQMKVTHLMKRCPKMERVKSQVTLREVWEENKKAALQVLKTEIVEIPQL